MTSLDQINARRLVLDIRKNIEQLMGAYIFEFKDDVTEKNIREHVRSLCDHYKQKGINVSLKPTRAEGRIKMSDKEKIIDILEEEINFSGGKLQDIIDLDILVTPPKQLEYIKIHFKIS